MAVVDRAMDQLLVRTVAIKFLTSSSLSSNEKPQRFQGKAKNLRLFCTMARSYNLGMDSNSLYVSNPGGQDDSSVASLQVLFDRYRPRLKMLVELRIDRRIRARLDSSDVIQDAFTDAVRRFPDYQRDRKLSPYIWLRFLTLQQLLQAHRKHLGVKARSAKSEQPIELFRACTVESDSIADCLLGRESSPSVKAQRNEAAEKLRQAIDQMDEVDREILVLRHFEQLEFAEVAAVVGLSLDAVSSRYRRALKKLGALIADGIQSGP